jgi:hypothetical protein
MQSMLTTAPSEIINHVGAGVPVDNIRAASTTRSPNEPARCGMVRALEERHGVTVHIPHGSQYVCALDAAPLGQRRKPPRRNSDESRRAQARALSNKSRQ